jgi:hypothetical protein
MGYFLTDQPSDGTRFLQFWVICLLMTIISHNLGVTSGAFFKNPQVSIHKYNCICEHSWSKELVIVSLLSGLQSMDFAN